MKTVERWYSKRVHQEVTLVRWGAVGTPVLLFPTAGGDAEEVERFGLIDSLHGLLTAGRVKVYSIDSLSGRSLLERREGAHSAWLLSAYADAIRHEVVAAIRADCRDDSIELITAGASVGAFHAVAMVCRHPHVFRSAVGMSGTYDIAPFLGGFYSDDIYYASPLDFLPDLDGEPLAALRRRFLILASGAGAWEDPGETWRMADALGRKGIPNRVDIWSENHAHDWATWREMLPIYLDDLS